MIEYAFYLVGAIGYAALMGTMKQAVVRGLTPTPGQVKLGPMNTEVINVELHQVFGPRNLAGDPEEENTTPWTDPKKAELDIDVLVSDEFV
jgi:hypothetical protein